MTSVEALYRQPWEELLEQAWALRRAHFPPVLELAVPGAKRYQMEGFCNKRHRFAAISLTGGSCSLGCEHCRGQLLKSMYAASTGPALRRLADDLVARGCQGVLLSGGADRRGRVPLRDHLDAIKYLKEMGLKVIVHTGLADEATARDLKAVGVDQVLVDVIGDEETIRQVYHLDRKPEDYSATLALLKETGLAIAPHVVIGLHFGRIRGELSALEMIARVDPEALVLVVLNPLAGTPMVDSQPPSAEVVGRLAAVARILIPERRISMGCARPPGPGKVAMEHLAISAGINALAYPSASSLAHARSHALGTVWRELCCSLA